MLLLDESKILSDHILEPLSWASPAYRTVKLALSLPVNLHSPYVISSLKTKYMLTASTSGWTSSSGWPKKREQGNIILQLKLERVHDQKTFLILGDLLANVLSQQSPLTLTLTLGCFSEEESLNFWRLFIFELAFEIYDRSLMESTYLSHCVTCTCTCKCCLR